MKPTYSAGEVAIALGGVVRGDEQLRLDGIMPLDEADYHHLSFLHRRKYHAAAMQSRAGAIIARPDVHLGERTLIVVPDPRSAYRHAIDLFHPPVQMPIGISSKAIIEDSAHIGEDVHIGAGAIIGAGVWLGNRAAVMAGAIVGDKCIVGDESIIHSGAVLYPGAKIGARVTIHACAVIGKDGFGFQRNERGLSRIRQVGTVVIEDDVEIGACTCIDRATLSVTRVGRGTKPPGPPTAPDGSFAPLPAWTPGKPRPANWPRHIHAARAVYEWAKENSIDWRTLLEPIGDEAVPSITAEEVQLGRAVAYINLLLRAWGKPVVRDALEAGLVFMLNDSIRHRVLSGASLRPTRATLKRRQTVVGMDAVLWNMKANDAISTTTDKGRMVIRIGQQPVSVNNAPSADVTKAKEAIQAVQKLGESRTAAEYAGVIDVEYTLV